MTDGQANNSLSCPTDRVRMHPALYYTRSVLILADHVFERRIRYRAADGRSGIPPHSCRSTNRSALRPPSAVHQGRAGGGSRP
jgi:hypothetical protein